MIYGHFADVAGCKRTLIELRLVSPLGLADEIDWFNRTFMELKQSTENNRNCILYKV